MALAPFQPRSPGRLGRWFLRRFGAEIVIEVSPCELRVVGLGREILIPADGRSGTPPLFGGSALDVPAPFDRLVAALRGAVMEVLAARRLKVKPAVTFRGVATLDAVLGGYQAWVLERAASDAGAHRVEFEPPLPTRSAGRGSDTTRATRRERRHARRPASGRAPGR